MFLCRDSSFYFFLKKHLRQTISLKNAFYDLDSWPTVNMNYICFQLLNTEIWRRVQISNSGNGITFFKEYESLAFIWLRSKPIKALSLCGMESSLDADAIEATWLARTVTNYHHFRAIPLHKIKGM